MAEPERAVPAKGHADAPVGDHGQQRRYPRIAAAVFLNLTRILSDRLEVTTEQFAAAG